MKKGFDKNGNWIGITAEEKAEMARITLSRPGDTQSYRQAFGGLSQTPRDKKLRKERRGN